MEGGDKMTSRYSGKRLSSAAVRKKKPVRHSGAEGRNTRSTSAERLRLTRFLICGAAFVLLVAAKWALPERMEAVNARLASALTRNMDVQAVFSAVGRGFSGKTESAAQELYQAVFHPSEERSVSGSALSMPEETPALSILQEYRAEPVVQAPAENTGASTLAYVLYSDRNLPENVSMEQAILNFDYCTPVCGALSSPFGYREHPLEGEERFHYGVDLAADSGTTVQCFADGTVTAVGESSSYGKYCIVTHAGEYATLYAHCSRITAASGAKVSKGEKIAEVGETGMATGPHLHFEVHRNDTYLNPIYYVSAA